MLSKDNVSNYLAGITTRPPEVTVSYIKELHSGHLATYPFSSLGVLLNEDLSLESQALFSRVIANKRGGYCFEHNKIFFEILRSLGFQCEIVLARVLHNRKIDVPRTHRITKVVLPESTYIVDVGFGPLCPREPLDLEQEKSQDQGDAVYRIIQPDEGRYLLQIEETDGWFTLYSFDNGHYTEADCLCGHHYSSTYPEAVFVNNLLVSLKKYDDVRVVKNGEFHRTGGGKNAVKEISSKDDLKLILTEEFGIKLTSEQLSMVFQGYCR